jgi:hypothetical protein
MTVEVADRYKSVAAIFISAKNLTVADSEKGCVYSNSCFSRICSNSKVVQHEQLLIACQVLQDGVKTTHRNMSKVW